MRADQRLLTGCVAVRWEQKVGNVSWVVLHINTRQKLPTNQSLTRPKALCTLPAFCDTL